MGTTTLNDIDKSFLNNTSKPDDKMVVSLQDINQAKANEQITKETGVVYTPTGERFDPTKDINLPNPVEKPSFLGNLAGGTGYAFGKNQLSGLKTTKALEDYKTGEITYEQLVNIAKEEVEQEDLYNENFKVNNPNIDMGSTGFNIGASAQTVMPAIAGAKVGGSVGGTSGAVVGTGLGILGGAYYISTSETLDIARYIVNMSKKGFVVTPERVEELTKARALTVSLSGALDRLGLGKIKNTAVIKPFEPLKEFALKVAGEGGTEVAQEGITAFIDFVSGTVDYSKAPLDYMEDVYHAFTGGAFYSGVFNMYDAIFFKKRAKARIKEKLGDFGTEEEREALAEEIFNGTIRNMSDFVNRELKANKELQEKHGDIMNRLSNQIAKQISDVGAFENMTESQKAVFIRREANRFANQVIAESLFRKVPADDIVKASDVVYENGELYLKGTILKAPSSKVKVKPNATADKDKIEYTPVGVSAPVMDEVVEIDGYDTVRLSGKNVPITYEIVEADTLLTSHSYLGTENPDYPKHLQNRNRGRKELVDQVTQMSAKLDPALLGKSVTGTDGAPIITQDGNVAIGNGRANAIIRAYDTGNAEEYRNVLAKDYDITGFERPVLVRRFVDNYSAGTMRKLIEDANTPLTAGFSNSEQALTDAGRLTDNTLSLLNPDYEIDTATNRDFVNFAFNEIIPQSERGRYLDDSGYITEDGMKRIKASTLAKIVSDEKLLSSILESNDETIRKASQGVMEVSAKINMLESLIKKGQVKPEYSIKNDIQKAFKKYVEAKRSKQDTEVFLNNKDLFETDLTPAQQKVLDIFMKSRNSGEVKNRLARYVQSAVSEGDSTQARMFGEPLTKEQILDFDKLHQEQIELAETMQALDRVSPEYKGETININGVERSVYNSEGNRIAKSEKSLRAFYKWFGDSKVVDEQGRPLVVYHGTPNGGFREFDTYYTGSNTNNADNGFWFTKWENAKTYSGSTDEFTNENTTVEQDEDGYDIPYEPRRGNYAVYLKAKNVAVYDYKGANFEGIAYYKYALRNEDEYDWHRDENGEVVLFDSIDEMQQYVDEHPEVSDFTQWDNPQIEESTREVAKLEEENGFDGVIFKNVDDEGRYGGGYTGATSVYVVFSPNQIKSVDNRGTFDLNDNDIYHQEQITEQEMDVANDMRKRLGVQGAIYELEYTKRLFDRNLHHEHPAVVEMTKKRIASLDRQIEWLRGGNQLTVTQKPVDQSMNAKAREYFGTTTNINEAGYIMQDGSMLDFSGKKFGGQAGHRTMDHREISSAFEEDGFNVEMTDFIDNGNIRFMPESKTFLMSRMPTPQQIEQIQKISDRVNGEVIIECVEQAKEWGSDYGFYNEYDKGTDFKTIKRDITSFFKTGKVSDTNKFLQATYVDEQTLIERENGPKIADDNETVEVVKIPENSIPDFETKVQLRKWLVSEFEKLGSAMIKSTNQQVVFDDGVAKRVIKNARNRKNNFAYPKIKDVVENAKYSGFRKTDEKHNKVKGQDIYHSAIIVGPIPYSVEFYVDIPKYQSGKSEFAGNKIRVIKIAPADTQVTSDNQNGLAQAYGAISNISLAVLRGKVNPARYDSENNRLYQRAFVGSRVNWEKDKPSLEAVGTGEGNQAHGWGLYYALKRYVAERYRETFIKYSSKIEIDGKEYDAGSPEGMAYSSYIDEKVGNKDINGMLKWLKELFDTMDSSVDSDYDVIKKGYEFLLKYKDRMSEIKEIRGKGQVYEVEIPENPYLLDEQEMLIDQSAFIREKIEQANKELDLGIEDSGIRGYRIYQKISDKLGSDKDASQYLEKLGVKGITYEGNRDGRCFVIFNPDDVQVIDKFYQSQMVNDTVEVPQQPRQKKVVKGSFDAFKKSIGITKDADASTYAHEFSHFWVDSIWEHIESGNAPEEYIKRFEGVMKYIGAERGKKLTREQHEKFARAYEKYLFTAEVPRGVNPDVFDEYETFIRDVYDDITQIDTRYGEEYEPITEEVYNFFNSMTRDPLPRPQYLAEDVEFMKRQEEQLDKDVEEVQTERNKVIEARANIDEQDNVVSEELREKAKELGVDVGKNGTYTMQPVQTDNKTGFLTAYKKTTGQELEAGAMEQEAELKRATEFVNNNPELAEQIVMGNVPHPTGYSKNAIYIAYNELQKKLGNTDKRADALINQALELRAMGQEISIQRLVYGVDPAQFINAIVNERTDKVAKRNGIKTRKELSDKIKDGVKKGLNEGKTPDQIVDEMARGLALKPKPKSEKEPDTSIYGYKKALKYVEERLGVGMSKDEAVNIIRIVDDMNRNLENAKSKNQNPTIEYFIKLKELEDYVNTLAPSSDLRVLVSVIGKANLLASIKSPVTNFVANIPTGLIMAGTRRVRLGVANSIVDSELTKRAKKEAMDIYKKTGFYIFSMDDPRRGTKQILSEDITNTSGSGVIKAYGRLMENLVFHWSMGYFDVGYKNLAFVDYASLKATKLANGDKAKANKLFEDACRIVPLTKEGKEIRNEAIQECLVATYQNKSTLSEHALKARDALDFGVGFGEIIVPFVKTPANVIGTGLRYSVGGVKAIASEVVRGIQRGGFKLSDVTPENRSLLMDNTVGFLIGLALASFFDDEDYMPPYLLATTKERQLAKELNIAYNSIRIDGVWYSLDYAGVFASPLVAILQARRGEGILGNIGGFTGGLSVQSLSIPGFANISDLVKGVVEFARKDPEKAYSDVAGDFVEGVYNRAVPMIVSDIAKAMDDYEREAKTTGERIQSKMPFAREDLPEKVSLTTGRPEQVGNAFFDIVMGSRAKPQLTNDVADEFKRLSDAGYGVQLTDVTQRGALSELEPEDKQQVREDFAKEYSRLVGNLIRGATYRRATDEEKSEMINKVRSKITKQLRNKYKNRRVK